VCAVWFVCLFIAFLQREKENVNSRTNLKAIMHVSEMVATSGKPNDGSVNQELKCLLRTRVLLIFGPTYNARSARKLLEVKRVRQK
jgi:hypothetical protein